MIKFQTQKVIQTLMLMKIMVILQKLMSNQDISEYVKNRQVHTYIWQEDMYGRVVIYFHIFLTSALDKGE